MKLKKIIEEFKGLWNGILWTGGIGLITDILVFGFEKTNSAYCTILFPLLFISSMFIWIPIFFIYSKLPDKLKDFMEDNGLILYYVGALLLICLALVW
jgi:hypothetical protein